MQEAEGARIAYLTPRQAERLLAAYNPWAAPVMLVLCETGLRTQEALRLDWRCVDWKRNVLIIEHTGRGRRAHEDGAVAAGGHAARRSAHTAQIWQARERPEVGPVFLSRGGSPTPTRVGLGATR